MIPLVRIAAFAPAFVLALLVTACATVPRQVSAPVEVGIIAINDFHGALEPPKQAVPTIAPSGSVVSPQDDVRLPGETVPVLAVPAGGAAWLASAASTARSRSWSASAWLAGIAKGPFRRFVRKFRLAGAAIQSRGDEIS